MASPARKIMYIGNKPKKQDNVNNNTLRVWNGLGDIIVVGELEARKLCLHVDIWRDVSEYSTEQMRELVNEKREHFRDRERDQHKRHISKVLGSVSEEELEAELAVRRGLRNMDRKAPSVLQVRDLTPGAGALPAPKTDGSRPSDSARLIEDIHGAIYAVMGEDLGVDEDGQPRLEAVVGRLGYAITEDELADCWKEMNAPKEPAAKVKTAKAK